MADCALQSTGSHLWILYGIQVLGALSPLKLHVSLIDLKLRVQHDWHLSTMDFFVSILLAFLGQNRQFLNVPTGFIRDKILLP